MKFIDPTHPFYKPLWRRIVLIGVLAGWSALEILVTREPMWMTIAVALLVISTWVFLITWKGQGD
jgi:uncharacterized membrane protein (UPF0136 family)